jgi:Fe-coproporphyrin III synthase
MGRRYARLTEDWLMRGWSDVPFAAVNWKTGDLRPVNPRIAHVLRGCDGLTDFDSLLFLPIHRKILDKLIEEGIAAECVEGETFAPDQGYRRADNPYLHSIHWSVTGRCNLKCRHCYMEAPRKRYRDMCAADVRRVIQQFARANVLRVGITGGEPFVREDLFAIIQQLLDCRILVHQIYSNGLLVTDRVLQQIKAMGLSPSFHLSFDGCGTHDRMRGTKGTEKPVLEAIARIRGAGLQVNVTTSVDHPSRECLPETYARLKDLQIHSWQVAPPHSTGNWCGSDTAISPAEEAALYAPILRRWHEDGRRFALQLGAFFNSRVDTVENGQTRFLELYTPEGYDCGVCRLVPYLLPDGTLLPCHGFTGTSLQKSMPNILQQELAAIWTASSLRDLAQAKKSVRLAANEECANCDFFEQCGMGCRARALIAAGDVRSKDPLTCEMWKKGYKQSLLR